MFLTIFYFLILRTCSGFPTRVNALEELLAGRGGEAAIGGMISAIWGIPGVIAGLPG